MDARLDSRFGRAPGFLLYDTETDQAQSLSNAQNLNAAQGAGIQAAQTVINAGADAVVVGHCGPKAYRVLNAAGVAIYNSNAATVGDALASIESGELKPAAGADVEGHWV